MLRSAVSVSSRVASGVRALSTSAVSKADAKPSKAELNEVFKDDSAPKRNHGYSVNRVELLGGVSSDPRILVAKNGRDYAVFDVITNSSRTLGNGEKIESTDRHSVQAFGKLSEVIAKRVHKGTRVLIHGRLAQTGGKLQEDGKYSHRQTYIHADVVMPLAKNE